MNSDHAKLVITAIPSLDGKILHDRNTLGDDPVLTPLPIVSPNDSPSVDNQSVDMSVYTDNVTPTIPEITPRKRKLIKDLGAAKLAVKRNKSQAVYWKNKHTMIKDLSREDEAIASSSFLPPDVHTLFKMQLQHKKTQPWTSAEKQLALAMHYKSPGLYSDLREKFGFNLPCKSTIEKWLSELDLQPGLCSSLMAKLREKMSQMTPSERECVLLFDEMSIKRDLQYSPRYDLIEGFEDLGELGRKAIPGSHVLVFMIGGLNHSYKMPIAFYVAGTNVSGEDMLRLLKQNITALFEAGANVRAFTCDQGPNNQSLVNQLNLEPGEHYFKHPNGRKIYVLYDVPHLIKSIRNNMISKDFFVKLDNIEPEQVSWRDLRDAYVIDQGSNLARANVKLSPRHIAPNKFDRMSVKLAVQALSASTAALINTLIQTKQLTSQTAPATAKFISRLNKLFDALNSSAKNVAEVQ